MDSRPAAAVITPQHLHTLSCMIRRPHVSYGSIEALENSDVPIGKTSGSRHALILTIADTTSHTKRHGAARRRAWLLYRFTRIARAFSGAPPPVPPTVRDRTMAVVASQQRCGVICTWHSDAWYRYSDVF